jgi:tetratricopeptide (TPR) repeat protein
MSELQLVQRAQLLIGQDRHQDAERVLRQVLAGNPDYGHGHALLALCLMHDRERLAEANREAEQAIHLAPDDDCSHYVYALVMDRRNLKKAALEAIEQAIAINPVEAGLHGLRAHLLGGLNRWREALTAAETGLSHDPENGQCSALRSLSLERTGRVSDALGEANRSVSRTPDSSDAHASRGWALLNQGNHKEARIAFREALRLEPGSEFARHGMIQAINSGNIVFRLFYRFMLWMSRLDSRVQWGLILGLWFGMRFLNSLARANPWLEPWVLPISITYLLFVMLTWILMPLFNTMLRFHPFGRHLLNRREIWASNLIAGSILSGILAGSAAWLIQAEPWMGIVLLLFAIQLTIPLAVAFNCEADWARNVATLFAIGFVLLYLSIVVLCLNNILPGPLAALFSLGLLFYCFFGQYLQSRKPRY